MRQPLHWHMIDNGWFDEDDLWFPFDDRTDEHWEWLAYYQPACEAHDIICGLFGLVTSISDDRSSAPDIGLYCGLHPSTPRYVTAKLYSPSWIPMFKEAVEQRSKFITVSAAIRARSAFVRSRRPDGPSITSSRETPPPLKLSNWTPTSPSRPKPKPPTPTYAENDAFRSPAAGGGRRRAYGCCRSSQIGHFYDPRRGHSKLCYVNPMAFKDRAMQTQPGAHGTGRRPLRKTLTQKTLNAKSHCPKAGSGA